MPSHSLNGLMPESNPQLSFTSYEGRLVHIENW